MPGWIIPVAAAALSLYGGHKQQQKNNRNQRRQIEFQRDRRRQQHEATMRANQMRLASIQRQQGYDAKQQSSIASAVQEGFGPKRKENIAKSALENKASQIAALDAQAKKGNLYTTSTKTKGRVSGKLKAGKKKSAGKNKKRAERRAGTRGLIGAYQRQPVADQRVSIGLNQTVGLNQMQAQAAARSAAARANIAGQIPPEGILHLNQTSNAAQLANAGAMGLWAYAPYAGGSKIASTAQSGGIGPVSRARAPHVYTGGWPVG